VKCVIHVHQKRNLIAKQENRKDCEQGYNERGNNSRSSVGAVAVRVEDDIAVDNTHGGETEVIGPRVLRAIHVVVDDNAGEGSSDGSIQRAEDDRGVERNKGLGVHSQSTAENQLVDDNDRVELVASGGNRHLGVGIQDQGAEGGLGESELILRSHGLVSRVAADQVEETRNDQANELLGRESTLAVDEASILLDRGGVGAEEVPASMDERDVQRAKEIDDARVCNGSTNAREVDGSNHSHDAVDTNGVRGADSEDNESRKETEGDGTVVETGLAVDNHVTVDDATNVVTVDGDDAAR